MTTPITYRTDDATRWGSGKGANLTAAEVDIDFWNLAQAIDGVANNLPQPDNISSITVSGTQMTVHLQSGTQFGPFPLPVLMFRWRGAWAANTGYNQIDAFMVAGQGLYVVLIAHTSAASFNEGATDPTTGNPIYNKLFGFSGQSGAALAGLTDVALSGLADQQVLRYDATSGFWKNATAGTGTLASLTDILLSTLVDKAVLRWVAAANKWENIQLGTMADQNANAVAITGGAITGLSDPTNSADAATKHYVDGVAVSGLPSIGDGHLLANTSGATARPIDTTLTGLLDYLMSTVRGSMLFRGQFGWTVLAPGTAGYTLQSQGAGADVIWSGSAGFSVFSGDTGSGGVKGLVPAPLAGDAAANKFLSAGGAFQQVVGADVFNHAAQGGI